MSSIRPAFSEETKYLQSSHLKSCNQASLDALNSLTRTLNSDSYFDDGGASECERDDIIEQWAEVAKFLSGSWRAKEIDSDFFLELMERCPNGYKCNLIMIFMENPTLKQSINLDVLIDSLKQAPYSSSYESLLKLCLQNPEIEQKFDGKALWNIALRDHDTSCLTILRNFL